jgi:hypothetical protein
MTPKQIATKNAISMMGGRRVRDAAPYKGRMGRGIKSPAFAKEGKGLN